ncbi:right-handed parallel beta-helix repeat-containing protein [Niabella pedocola]|uniref:Right-handed parallel beta-helix repeat-containing protein n=1 Tax=Niabella pedocola TaxID=1752077 RepID=A0ABS8PZC8_9BACT|nr:right-handed parallel beta-helix repeat-containing protein [Niabella pedocola]MCD2426250.1 right-handed parallel beta-helix repeat-containing protein [Niabella pedocola]
MLIVHSISALRSTGAPSDNFIKVLGYYSAGDGGGGDFLWDALSTSAEDGGTIFESSLLTTGRWKRIYSGDVSVDWFGAKGDGSTNDTTAFQKLSAFINNQNGGSIVFGVNKIYIIGRQNFANGTGKGYAYQQQPVLKIENCTQPVMIKGNGAVLKFAGGMKFGSHDPVTGNAYIPSSMPFVNADYIGNIGTAIEANNNKDVSILNLEIDGNDTAQSIGGQWGDTGYQNDHTGIRAYGNETLTINTAQFHHLLLDGIMTGWTGLTEESPAKPTQLVNVNAHHNGRQGWSIVGGKCISAENCRFTDTGKSVLASSPGAGVDIEAEDSVVKNAIFTNCTFANNSGCGVVADSGNSSDIKFNKCNFYGTTSTSIFINKKRVVFEDCLISGEAYPSLATYANDTEKPRYKRCVFTPASYEGLPVFGTQLMDGSQPAIFDECLFYTTDTAIKLGTSVGVTYIDCRFLQNGSNGDSYIRGTFRGLNIVDITTGSNDFYGYKNEGDLKVSGNVLSIIKTNAGQSFTTSYAPLSRLRVGGINNDNIFNELKIWFNTDPPTIYMDYWNAGDIIFNTRLTPGVPLGWKCTVSGDPGTWVAFGIQGGVQAAAQANSTATDVAGVVTDLNALLTKLKASGLMD